MRRKAVRRTRAVLALAAIGPAVLASAAGATFPGTPGPIVFSASSPASGPVAKFGSSGNGDIYSVRSDGAGMRRLTPRTPPTKLDPAEGGAAVSPDGRWIAYGRRHGSDGGIYLMRSDGSGRRRIRSSAGSPAWSPDGKRIAFADEDGIHSMRRDGRDVRLIVATERFRAPCPPNVTPERCELMARPIITYAVGSPSWSPDGTRVAFVQQQPDGESSAVYTVPAGGGPKTLVVDRAIRPDWSPDGKRLLFLRETAPDNALWVTRSDGSGGGTPLARGDILAASFSPDGSRIVYVRNSDGADITIIKSVTGKLVRRLVGGKVVTSHVTWGARP